MSVFTVPPFLPDPPDVKRLLALYERCVADARTGESESRLIGRQWRRTFNDDGGGPAAPEYTARLYTDVRDHAATAADLASWAATEAARILAEDRDDLVMLAYLDGHRVGRSEGYADGYEAGAAYGHLDGLK